MKTTSKIHWKTALDLIKTGNRIDIENIDFGDEKIHWKIVKEFNEYGHELSESLVEYDDDSEIDFSDIPELNEENLKNGTYRYIIPISFEYEIANWLKSSKINYNALINEFLKSVYQSITTLDLKEREKV